MNLEAFLSDDVPDTAEIETERRNRIRLSLAAYSYEFESVSWMSDGDFDALALKINPSVSTNHPVLDEFFKSEFSPETGQWIHRHPELDKLRALWIRFTWALELQQPSEHRLDTFE